jgi:hypothetical protein
VRASAGRRLDLAAAGVLEDWRARSSGWCPTTPEALDLLGPPLPSSMSQWRLISCSGTSPALVIVTVYANA